MTTSDLTGTIEADCAHCGRAFRAMTLFGRRVGITCSDECLEAYRAAHYPEARPPVGEGQHGRWAAICPPRYARFDADRLPPSGGRIAPLVFAWKPDSKRGMALVGPSDSGKSMILHELARRAFFAGYDVHVTSGVEFAFRVGSPEGDERRKEVSRCCQAAILLVDDIGKEKMTDRVEADFYHVLEHREKWGKPLLFTCNVKGKALASMLSEDRADPIVNRLRRSAEVLAIP